MTNETVEPEITAAGNEVSASFLAAKKRSDETMAALEANPGKFTMLTWATTSVRSASAWPCRSAV